MRYPYKCKNEKCTYFNLEIVIDKPLTESNTSEYCRGCKKELKRVYSFGAKTGDGFKS